MQTNFSPEALADPQMARSNEVLRACVHCGFCTATCPTYQVLGDELDSPRGRIYLMKEMLESGRPADAKTVKHIDRCLSCLACMTTCPSGVHYMHLVDHAREYIEQTYRRPLPERMLRWLLAFVLPYPGRFRLALRGAQIGRPFAGWMPGRLKGMVAMAPETCAAGEPDGPAAGLPGRGRAADAGGADDRLRPAGAQHRHQRGDDPAADPARLRGGGGRGRGLLRRADPPHGQDGVEPRFARENIEAWMREKRGAGLDAVVINTSGCGTTVKDYGHIFRTEALAEDAAAVSAMTRDVSEIMVELGLRLPERAARGAPGRAERVLGRRVGYGGGRLAPLDRPLGGRRRTARRRATSRSGPRRRTRRGRGSGGAAGAGARGAAGRGGAGRRRERGGSDHRGCGSPITRPARSSTASRSRRTPKTLLKAAGFEVVEPADAHLCCGSAGTYNLMQPEIAGELKARKVRTLEAVRPEVIAAGNIGCMVQIGGGTGVPVVHTVELLDWATGGPRPKGAGSPAPRRRRLSLRGPAAAGDDRGRRRAARTRAVRQGHPRPRRDRPRRPPRRARSRSWATNAPARRPEPPRRLPGAGGARRGVRARLPRASRRLGLADLRRRRRGAAPRRDRLGERQRQRRRHDARRRDRVRPAPSRNRARRRTKPLNWRCASPNNRASGAA
jgi:glycolate oxidase iron-sulfur subunit